MNPTETSELNRKRRRRYSASEKHEILSAYEQRQTTQQEFCRERGLCVATLGKWLASGGPNASGLVELRRPSRASDDDYCVEMELQDGTVLRILVGTDPRWLRQLLPALRCGV